MKIPNNIILTWKDDDIPEYVIPNIKKLNPDKEILFFTDDDVVKFLSKEYDSSYVDFFHTIKRGCNKGDFFRYCYLYKEGGYYCDVDIRHLEPIKNYISPDIDFEVEYESQLGELHTVDIPMGVRFFWPDAS